MTTVLVAKLGKQHNAKFIIYTANSFKYVSYKLQIL